jgi:hypothetical protein
MPAKINSWTAILWHYAQNGEYFTELARAGVQFCNRNHPLAGQAPSCWNRVSGQAAWRRHLLFPISYETLLSQELRQLRLQSAGQALCLPSPGGHRGGRLLTGGPGSKAARI